MYADRVPDREAHRDRMRLRVHHLLHSWFHGCLLGLRLRPSGRRRCTATFCASTQRWLVEPGLFNRGFELLTIY